MKKLIIELPDHFYNKIMAFRYINIGARVSYKSIIVAAFNAIKDGTVITQETENKT